MSPSVFLFQEDTLSKFQWIFTKLGVCIHIVETGSGLLIGKFCQVLTVIYLPHVCAGVLSFQSFYLNIVILITVVAPPPKHTKHA